MRLLSFLVGVDSELILCEAIRLLLRFDYKLHWAHPRFCRGTTVFQNLFR